ncbi:structural maintenance of chromosomes protein 4 [Dorcoceras hygrometricum]|uniref:Structural maintenance of chromosomes protein 4 n=1 Tax=Dorcoceras hygrometricum TaxID=472368 RepID=A0A2Z7B8L6_9LAMI|nr:structural maintenance of chromosomes protein 4 [Dorcoceras hygrometricum]
MARRFIYEDQRLNFFECLSFVKMASVEYKLEKAQRLLQTLLCATADLYIFVFEQLLNHLLSTTDYMIHCSLRLIHCSLRLDYPTTGYTVSLVWIHLFFVLRLIVADHSLLSAIKLTSSSLIPDSFNRNADVVIPLALQLQIDSTKVNHRMARRFIYEDQRLNFFECLSFVKMASVEYKLEKAQRLLQTLLCATADLYIFVFEQLLNHLLSTTDYMIHCSFRLIHCSLRLDYLTTGYYVALVWIHLFFALRLIIADHSLLSADKADLVPFDVPAVPPSSSSVPAGPYTPKCSKQVSISCLKKEMKIQYHLLSDILAKTLYVKAGSFDAVTRDRFMLMTAITFNVKINWSSLLFGVLQNMVTPGSRQAKGFSIQICVLLKNVPGLVLGESRAFPTSRVLIEKTVHRPVGDGEEAPIVKKKRTTKGKPVVIAQEAVALQSVRATTDASTEQPPVPKRKSQKRKRRLILEGDDEIVDSEPEQPAAEAATDIQEPLVENEQVVTTVDSVTVETVVEKTCCSQLFEGRSRTPSDAPATSNFAVSRQRSYDDTLPPMSAFFKLMKKRALSVVEPVGSFVLRHPTVFALRLYQFCTVFFEYSLFSHFSSEDITSFVAFIASKRTNLRSVQITTPSAVSPRVPILLDQRSSSTSSSDESMHFDDQDTATAFSLPAATLPSLPAVTTELSTSLDDLRIFISECFDNQAEATRQIDDAQSDVLSRLHTIKRDILAALMQQEEAFRNLINTARQDGRTLDDSQTLLLNEFRKVVLAQSVSATADMLEVRKEIKALDAKVDAVSTRLDDVKKDVEATKEAISHQLLDFQAQAQANYNILTGQLSELVNYINRGGNDKKGEGSSRGPQPPPDDQNRDSGNAGGDTARSIVERLITADIERERSRGNRSGSYKRRRY